MLDWIIEELKYLQQDYDLGNFYIFESSKDHYHAVCLTKVSLVELINIMKSTSIDYRYIDVPLRWGKKLWTLRVKGKSNIKYLITLNNRTERQQSTSHWSVLRKLFKLQGTITNGDGLDKVVMARYNI